MTEVNTLVIPVKTGFKQDEGFHRRNYRSIEDFLASPHISSAQIIELSADKITAGTLSSTVLVTGLIQSPSATGYRIELGNASFPLRYWNGTTTKLSVDTAGNVIVNGAITATSGSFTGTINASGGSITGTLDVSGLIRAPSSGYRVEIGDATYPLRYWNGSSTFFRMDTSGNVLLAGTIQDTNGTPIIRSNGLSRVKIRNGAGSTISNDTETTMDWVTEDSDTDSYWNGSNTYVIVPFTGQYLVIAQASFATDPDGRRYIEVQKADSPYSSWNALQGASFASAAPIANNPTTCLVSDVFDLNAAQGVRLRVFHNSGAGLNTTGRLALVFLGPT